MNATFRDEARGIHRSPHAEPGPQGPCRSTRAPAIAPSLYPASALSPPRISAAVCASAPSDATAAPTAPAACGRP